MNKFVTSILSLSFIFLVSSITYSAYKSEWHGVDFIRDGNVIPAKQTAENFLYLYNKTQELDDKLKGLGDCGLSVDKSVSCKYKVSCNCGKYGCSTCEVPGTKAVLNVVCKDGTSFKFDGVCSDARIAASCGKYGCQPQICSSNSVVCSRKGNTHTICDKENPNSCYRVKCERGYCYKI